MTKSAGIARDLGGERVDPCGDLRRAEQNAHAIHPGLPTRL
jgi:hypothetical protein